jgi:phasin family protein
MRRPTRTPKPHMEAVGKYGTVVAQAFQDTLREWYGLAQKQWQRNLEGVSKLAHCRSVQEFVAAQSSLVRESLQRMVEDSRSIAEISLKAVNDASKASARPVQERTAQERGHSSALAA